ncbi:response regulator [Angelakisella massiliensis]|uniref:response regulator n=1 Tax=Angelakisella massiliensis TaxID=1871018 RepID=UPI0024B133AF|nr:response regulator [Angelakisella massiliensis]
MIRDTLLIIDDSELDLAILNEIFKNIFHVECAADTHRGLSFIHQHHERICAVLLDICLERRGTGFTVLHQLQTNPSTAALPVILITTDASETDVVASVERGAVDFLVKPVNPHTVQTRVCDVIRTAWPAGSTVLDRKNDSPDPEPENQNQTLSDPEHMELDAARAFYDTWNRKLESFCRLRRGMDMEGHRQLGKITMLLAQRYAQQFPQSGITSNDAVLIGFASTFCDIGLLGLPDNVVEAGEKLNDTNAALYFQHIWLGYELFAQENQKSPLLQYAAEIALWHHKNADGSGYPQQADSSAIPLSAQLTHTALRIQHHLSYCKDRADRMDRVLSALKNDIGIIISAEMYQIVLLEAQTLSNILASV